MARTKPTLKIEQRSVAITGPGPGTIVAATHHPQYPGDKARVTLTLDGPYDLETVDDVNELARALKRMVAALPSQPHQEPPAAGGENQTAGEPQ